MVNICPTETDVFVSDYDSETATVENVSSYQNKKF